MSFSRFLKHLANAAIIGLAFYGFASLVLFSWLGIDPHTPISLFPHHHGPA